MKKIVYALFSLFKLALNIKNPFSIIKCFFNKPAMLIFKNGLIIEVIQPLDLIIIKETILDDDYRINSLKNPKAILDVGAGVGDFTILAAKKFPRAVIYSFEPNKKQYQVLLKNIKLNSLKNIKTFNVAIGTKKSYQLFLPVNNVHASTIDLKKPGIKINVKGRRLDGFINGKIDLLKIDCEGAEIDILNSIKPNKMVLIRSMMIEYHNRIIQNEDKKITSILSVYRYKIKKIKNTVVSGTGYIFAHKF